MPFSVVSPTVGLQQIANFGLPDSTARVQPGLVVDAVDPYWGAGEFIYVKANGAITAKAICVVTPVVTSGAVVYNATEVPNTANLGRMVGVAMTPMDSGEFGWLQIGGMTPVKCGASVAADTSFGITAAGSGGAVAAGKQILNARVMIAAAATVAKAGVANSGSLLLQVTGADGWFIGAYLSGTGIAAGTTIVDIDPSGTQVTLSAVTTAAVNSTVTATYNNATIFYNVAHLNRPFAQGAIT